MENETTNVEDLFNKLKDYGDTRVDLFKLKAINKISGFLSSLITSIILIVLSLLIIICISIGLALLIGSFLEETYYGFFIVGGIYFIIGLILFATKTKILKTPISNSLLKELLD